MWPLAKWSLCYFKFTLRSRAEINGQRGKLQATFPFRHTHRHPSYIPPIMDSAALQSLSRAELQNLAKANNVKANLRSATIIALLLERNDAAPAVGGNDEERPAHGTFNSTRAEGLQPPQAIDLQEGGAEVVGSVYSLSPSPPPPQFSREISPQPVAERTLRLLTKKMALISRGIEERRGGAQGLRRMAARKSDRAKEVRALVDMIHAERVRMQTHFAHVERVEPEWTDRSQVPPPPPSRADKGKNVNRGAPLPPSSDKGNGVARTPAMSVRSTRSQMAAKALARVANKRRAHAPAVVPTPITEEAEEAEDTLSVIAMLSVTDDMDVDEAGDAAGAEDV
ncbi:hypothetical protein B0H21DRAFT_883130 [Amylocystis lapponica]|nr:hypothetical protein B0H21DRAFT_883130 [Amylocystis lapponica]